MVKITLADHENECKCSCTRYIVLFSIIFTISIGIGTYFIYYIYINPGKKTVAKRVIFFRQQFTKHIKMVKGINIKHRSYYLFNDMTDLEDIEEKNLKLDNKNYKHIGIY